MRSRAGVYQSNSKRFCLIRPAAWKALQRLRAGITAVGGLPGSQGVELLERRVLLSAYTLNQLATFGLNASGADPQSNLVADASGDLYGTASGGGNYGDGTVFEIAKGSNTITSLVSFNGTDGAIPLAGVAFDELGNLYGTTTEGGTFGDGTVYEIAKGSSGVTTLSSFNGQQPAGTVAVDAQGNIYGVANDTPSSNRYGYVFEVAKGSKNLTWLAILSEPANGVILNRYGNLFGTTVDASDYGYIFELPKGSVTYQPVTVVASFNGTTDGANPSVLTMDAAGDLFGTTLDGNETLFEMANGSDSITTLASFDGANGDLPRTGVTVDAAGNLYGTTEEGGANYRGNVYELPNGSQTVTTLASFNFYLQPKAVVLDSSGDLFGTTELGGANGTGMVFEVANGSPGLTTFASFDPTNGQNPESPLTCDAAGDLFGTTQANGPAGTIFEIAQGSNAITTLATISSSYGDDGLAADTFGQNGVTLDAAGNIYGTTDSTGTGNYGTVFELPKGSNVVTTIASFNDTDGSDPSQVTLNAAGDVFGTTEYGGAGGGGTIFEIACGSGTITSLASFSSSRLHPSALTLDPEGDLYGITSEGGSQGYGTAFELAVGSNTITILASFTEETGTTPSSGLVIDSAGNLYGATAVGAMGEDGGLYEIVKGSSTIVPLASMQGPNGAQPTGLTMDASGNLYGTTYFGGTTGDYGTVFELPKGSNMVTTLASFSGVGPQNPYGGMTIDPWGNLYGTTMYGPYSEAVAGTVFELATNTMVSLTPDGGANPSNAADPLTFTEKVAGGVPNSETVQLVDASNNNAVVATGTLSDGTATLSVPAGALLAGTHNLVAAYGGDANFAASESAPYVQIVLPAVTGISPSGGPASGGTTVTVTGAGFIGATAADFGSTPATSFTVNAAGTQITAVDPAGSGTVDVTVVTPGGTSASSTADQFTYAAALPAWIAAESQATWNASTNTLTVTGAATIIADPGGAEPNIVANGSGAVLTINPVVSPSDIHIGGITFTDGASIVMSDVDATQVADGTNAANHKTDHNVLVIGMLGAVSDPTISIDSASKLDLGDNDLIVHTGSSDKGTDDVQGFAETNELKAIEALAAMGRNVAPGGIYNGTWTGNGLTSSAAATADSDAGYEQNILAVEQNSDMYLGGYSSWTVGSATEKLGANDIIVKYTYNGDLNLDGAVDGNAATIFSTFYDGGATSGNTYAYGDLNGDGKIDGNDATIFSTVYGNGLAGSGLPQL